MTIKEKDNNKKKAEEEKKRREKRINKKQKKNLMEMSQEDVVTTTKEDDISETFKNHPEVAKLIAHYKEIAFRWNQIASYVAGKTRLNENVSQQQHTEWLSRAYYSDVLFLLNQLGVVQEQHVPQSSCNNNSQMLSSSLPSSSV